MAFLLRRLEKDYYKRSAITRGSGIEATRAVVLGVAQSPEKRRRAA
jgi:hypothetical protein